ncbi:MAG: hypothetical protein ACHQRM_01830 [Bacteroidia bacterium]
MNFSTLIVLLTLLLLICMGLLFFHFRRKEAGVVILVREPFSAAGFARSIIKLILSQRKDIREIRNLDIIKMTEYNEQNLNRLTDLISEGKFAELELLETPKETSAGEELSVVKFLDQESNVYLGLVYDDSLHFQSTKLLWIYPI